MEMQAAGENGKLSPSPSIDLQTGESGGCVSASDIRGKHRIIAELKRLEQESKSLEEELEELEKTERVSAACQEFLSIVESRPDPLLPVTNGPANPSWDLWFEGPQDPQACKCAIQ